MTKINNTGIISKKIVTDNLYNTQGDKYLTASDIGGVSGNFQEILDNAVQQATEDANEAKVLAETAAVNALESERNVTNLSENLSEHISEILSADGEIRITSPHTIGDFYFSITSHMPDGVLPLNGSVVSRITYSDFYDYVLNIHNELVTSGKKFIISEEEWQNISNENNGYVPYYSYGTGEDLFRLPRMSGYLKATGELDESGNYIAEGLPNITGQLTPFIGNSTTDFITKNGAFSNSDVSETKAGVAGSAYTYRGINFDASFSNPIYGNSEHVTPETNTLFVGVWALTAFTQVGTANLNEIKEILSQCQTILGDSLPLLSSRYDNKGLETSAWKLSDGSWLDGRIYIDAYNKILQRIAEGDSTCLEMKESELLSTSEFPENFLIDTESVKFRLPLFVVNERTIIKEYKDGTEWYRVYSDGFIEQGGEYYNNADENVYVNFLIPFKDTTYSVSKIVGVDNVYNTQASAHYYSTSNYTTETFMTRTYASDGLNRFRWYAFGYGELIPREEWEIDFNYYFKVSNGVDDLKENYNQITQSDYVIEHFREGANWYRLYKSGWIEMGGLATFSEEGTQVNFDREMDGIDYLVYFSIGTTDYKCLGVNLLEKNVDGFKGFGYNGSSTLPVIAYWEVKGQIKQS